jgi:hypothetical protein
MSSAQDRTPRLQLTPSIALPILAELFQQADQWNTKAITKEMVKVHASRGGVLGTQEPWKVTKRALQIMRTRGLVMSPAPHTWIRTGKPIDLLSAGARRPSDRSDTDNGSDGNSPEEDIESQSACPPLWSTMVIEKEVGEGRGAVYVYFSETDRELAILKRQSRWRCKIGFALDGNPRRRIMGQAIHTSMSRMPVIGLVIRTEHCKSYERLLHRGLHAAGRRALDSPGAEWFETTPSEIEEWSHHIECAMRVFSSPTLPSDT